MKLKKKVKRILIAIVVVAIIALAGLYLYKSQQKKAPVKEIKVINQIEKYGYALKENKPSTYKSLFTDLEKILNEDPVDEEKYASKSAEMFVYDFYSLADKDAKTDIGGVEFVYPSILDNFLQNAQNTYYKYIESNIYNERKQSLPVVSNIEVTGIEKAPFAYGDKTDENAYKVAVTWSYTDDQFSSYQKAATLIFIHENEKLYLVELQ